MTRVRTMPKPSPIHGVGLFALEDIQSGELIWEPDAQHSLHRPAEVNAMDPIDQWEVRFYGWWSAEEVGWIHYPEDDCRFINHSTTPNTRTDTQTGCVYAYGRIPAGAEITQDYRKFEDPLRGELMPGPDDEEDDRGCLPPGIGIVSRVDSGHALNAGRCSIHGCCKPVEDGGYYAHSFDWVGIRVICKSCGDQIPSF